jgi:hypothetical protein
MSTRFNVRDVDLARLNSITKYPSIPTYHRMGERGELSDERVSFEGRVIGTEKVDGTNSRVILLPDGTYLIGSREELLYARGDLIGNPALGIVDAVRSTAERLAQSVKPEGIVVLFMETFGGSIGSNARQYTAEKRTGLRLFDVALMPDYEAPMGRSPAEISLWREGGGQPFAPVDELPAWAERAGIESVPALFDEDASPLPESIEEVHEFLSERLPSSRCALDEGAGCRAEGIVVRTADRRIIAKLRFEDYERTLRKRGQLKKN